MPGDSSDGNIPLNFTTYVDAVKSNSLINNTDDLQSYSISLLANASIQGGVYDVFNNDRLDFNSTDDIWSYGTSRYWIPGARYSFAAFAPYASTNGSSAGVGNTLSNGTVSYSSNEGIPVLTITDYNTGKFDPGNTEIDARSEDLLVAHYVRDNSHSNDYSTVPLTFSHILSCVTFSIRNTTNDDITKVSAITLEGLKYECDITLNTTSVSIEAQNETGDITSADRTPEAGATSFLPKGMAETDYKPLFDCEILTLLPQMLYGNDDIRLTFKVHKGAGDVSGTTYTLNLGNIETIREWKQGIRYNYSMTITSTDIIFQVVEVPWIEHDVEL